MSFQAFPETKTDLMSTVFNSGKWILIDYLSGIRKICGRFTKVLVGIPDVRDNQKIQLRVASLNWRIFIIVW